MGKARKRYKSKLWQTAERYTAVRESIDKLADLVPENKGGNACGDQGKDNHRGNDPAAKPPALGILARLAEIKADRVSLFFNIADKALDPADVRLGQLVNVAESANLVSDTVTDITVMGKTGQHLLPLGRILGADKPVHVLGNSSGDDTELVTAYFVQLNVRVEKCAVVLFAHSAASFG